jgi:hypothetical protein
LSYPRYELFKHIIDKDNISIITTRLLSSSEYNHIFISNEIVDKCTMSNKGKETNYTFPIYLYPNENSLTNERTPNLNLEIVKEYNTPRKTNNFL